MLGFLYILLSSAFYGFSNAYWKKAIQDAPFLQVIFSRGLYTTSFFGLCYLMDYQWGIFTPWVGARPVFSTPQLVMSIGLCIFSSFGLYFFVRSMKSEAVSLVAPVSSINLFGLLTAVLFLGESWVFSYSMASLSVVGGVFLLFQSDWHFSSISSFMKALGGSILERHFTDNMNRIGPDIICSMDEQNAAALIESSNEIWQMRGGTKAPAKEEQVTIDFAFATVCTIANVKQGEVFTKENIWVKRPGTGTILAEQFNAVLGKIAVKDIENDEQLDWTDFE